MDWKARLSLISILLIPVVAVAVVVVVLTNPFSREVPTESDEFFQAARELGPNSNVLIPNLRGARVVTPDRPHDPVEARTPEALAAIGRRRVFEITTNSLGLRGPELGPKDGYRVLCVGESVTFGWGVAADESYPALLAEELGVEVVNAGIPAMRPTQMVRWLERYTKTIQPDLVLFTARPDWMLHDPWRNYFDSIQQVRRTMYPTPVALILPPISTFDLRGRDHRPKELERLQKSMDNVPWLDLTPAFRAAMKDATVSRRGRGVVLEPNGSTQRVMDAESGSLVLEASSPDPTKLAPQVVAWLEANPSYAEPLMFDGAHPDAEGFEVFAETVAAFVRKQGWR